MKTSNVILFIVLLMIIVSFTKLKMWFPINVLYIVCGVLLFCVLKFWEIHRENKKREYLVNEIRTG
jgi:uncharacterized membrane protein